MTNYIHRNKDKLAILGKCTTRDLCPFDDSNLDIWQINHHSTKPKRVDKVVDIHKNGHDGDINYNNFPFEDVNHAVNGQILNNTLSFLLVYAVLLGYKEIQIYGCKFDGWEECRKYQKQNVQQVIFWCETCGVHVVAPHDNLIPQFKPYIEWNS